MKHSGKTEERLAAFFEQMKAEEKDKSPSFSVIYKKAATAHQHRNLLRYLVAAILLIAIIIGAWQYEQRFNSSNKEIPIIRASVAYYNDLMMDGKIVINDIQFEYDEANITPESQSILQSIAQMMKTHPQLRLSIEGHTDNSGASYYNLLLSEMRAAAVKQALTELKIEDKRLISNGFGETQPAYNNETEMGRKQNRRVEFLLID